jgi:hypothetical protein
MMKEFRIISTAVFCGIYLFSCVKKPAKNEVEMDLKTAMGLYLNHQPKIDTSKVKFDVLTVTYYEASKGYICEFKVNMKQKMPDHLLDTTGFMKANISKDFKTVSRKF